MARLHALDLTHVRQDRLRGFVLARGGSANLPPELRRRFDEWRAAIDPELKAAWEVSRRAGFEALRDADATIPRIRDLYLEGRHRSHPDFSEGNIFVTVPGVPENLTEQEALEWALRHDALGPPADWRSRLRLIDF